MGYGKGDFIECVFQETKATAMKEGRDKKLSPFIHEAEIEQRIARYAIKCLKGSIAKNNPTKSRAIRVSQPHFYLPCYNR